MSDKKNPRLGRGLEELTKLKGLDKILPKPINSNDLTEDGRPLEIALTLIDSNPDQPRRLFNQPELETLADSIRDYGFIEPLVVAKKEGGRFELISGERRLRAASLANIEKVPVIIRELTGEPSEKLILALIENLHRSDLNPVEEAESFSRLEKNFGKTHQEIALMTGRERPSITNSVRLLKLPDFILNDIANRRLSAGQGKALLGLTDQNSLPAVRSEILAKNLSVRQTEFLVRRLNKKKNLKETPPNDQVYYEALSKAFSDRLNGLKVKINYEGRSKKIEIFYNDTNELENLMSLLGARIT